jgi:hypothetical protein
MDFIQSNLTIRICFGRNLIRIIGAFVRVYGNKNICFLRIALSLLIETKLAQHFDYSHQITNSKQIL